MGLVSSELLKVPFFVNLIVLRRTFRKLGTTYTEQVDQVLFVFIYAELRVLSANLFANHVVLSKCSSFVRNQELNTSKLFRDVRVSCYCALDTFVGVYAIAIPKFSQVQIDSQRNWNDRRE